MIDKVFNFLMNVLPNVHNCPVRKKGAPLLPCGDSKLYTSGSIASSQRMLIEINKSGYS